MNTENPYSTRKRRNLNLSGTITKSKLEEDIAVGIEWDKNHINLEDDEDVEIVVDEEVDLEVGEELEVEEDDETETITPITDEMDLEDIMIGNKKLNIDKFKQTKQNEELKKVTIYLNKNLVMIMDILKKQKIISSYGQFITEALEKHLTT